MIDHPETPEEAGRDACSTPERDSDAPPTPHGRDTVDRGISHGGRDKSQRIDLGLALLARRTLPGETYTHTEIAAYCGCSSERIRQIEMRALRKVRARFKHADELREYFATLASRQQDNSIPNLRARSTHHV